MPKQLAWEAALEVAAKSDAGYLWTRETGEKIPLVIDLESITVEEPDDLRKFKWVSVGMEHPDSEGQVEQTEIPFWAKKSFFSLIKTMKEANDVPRDGVVEVWFERYREGDQNKGRFLDSE